ncbi:hypothetical protein ABT144_24170 [Streptomyces sp. NPDC002039]|uniref:hypothetical protein n=1 Tax=Streptomyces sp. NPDC002039 TaxID=3154660 RepID=UPI003326BC9B
MISPLSKLPERKHLITSLALATLLAVGWYGFQPVPTDCVVYHGSYVPLERNGPTTEQLKELERQASEAGGCPQKRRWDTWGFSI